MPETTAPRHVLAKLKRALYGHSEYTWSRGRRRLAWPSILAVLALVASLLAHANVAGASVDDVVAVALASGGGGWEATASGTVLSFGGAPELGGATQLNEPIVGMAATPDGGGYWLVAADGGVFSFGDASFYGSTAGISLNAPVVGMAATPDGGGYWVVAADGGVFSFGDASFYGSTAGISLSAPVVGIAATPDGEGYWLAAADGGVFSFGDAPFWGADGITSLNQPVVGIAANPTDFGYWLVAADGGVFSFGDAPFDGSEGGQTLDQPVVGMGVDPNGGGYSLATSGADLYDFTGPTGDPTTTTGGTSPTTTGGTDPTGTNPSSPTTTTGSSGPSDGGTQPGQSVQPGYNPFLASWADPLPATTTVASNSARIVRNLVTQYEDNYGSVGVNNGAYGIGMFPTSASQPAVRVEVAHGCNNFTPDVGQTVPIPADASPASGTDSSMVIWQPSTNTEWELWRAQNNYNGTWSACWGGQLDNLTTSSGVFPSPYGLSASGISALGTTISESDVASGAINHVLSLTVIDCNGGVAPADRTDCGSDPGEPSEGTWFRLPASLSMPSGLTPFAKMVFVALQEYGAVVTDQSGTVMLGAQVSADWAAQGHSGTDPITSSFAGEPEYDALNGIPWWDLQVINPPA